MREKFRRLNIKRIVAEPTALDTLASPENMTHQLRIAADEMWLLGRIELSDISVADEHAIVINDQSFSGVFFTPSELQPILERVIEWELPTETPAFAQGMVAGIPAKLVFDECNSMLLCPAVYAAEMEDRLNLSEHYKSLRLYQ